MNLEADRLQLVPSSRNFTLIQQFTEDDKQRAAVATLTANCAAKSCIDNSPENKRPRFVSTEAGPFLQG